MRGTSPNIGRGVSPGVRRGVSPGLAASRPASRPTSVGPRRTAPATSALSAGEVTWFYFKKIYLYTNNL